MRFGREKSMMDRAHDYVDAVVPQMEAALETARDQAGSALHDARDKAAPALADARDRAVPLLQDARDRAVPLLQEAREKAAPVIAEGRAKAAEKAAAATSVAAERAADARDAAAAKAAELRKEADPKGGKLKKLLLIGGLLAIAGVVFSKLRGSKQDNSNWQSSYTPTPAPAAAKPSTPAATTAPITPAAPTSGAFGDPLTDPFKDDKQSDDVAGGGLGEALSDSVEAPHEASTPDAPVEVIDVDDVPDKKN